jgi:hypothetical protein
VARAVSPAIVPAIPSDPLRHAVTPLPDDASAKNPSSTIKSYRPMPPQKATNDRPASAEFPFPTGCSFPGSLRLLSGNPMTRRRIIHRRQLNPIDQYPLKKPQTMADPDQEPFLSRLIGSAGSGFLMSQGIALASSFYHAAVHAPPGRRISDIFQSFPLSSYQSGCQSAAWSIVNVAVDPISARLVSPGWVRSAVRGALTGAVLQARSGAVGMVSGAVGGAVQCIGLSLLEGAFVAGYGPIQKRRMGVTRTRFGKERSQAMFAHPFSVMRSAFF